MSRIRLRLESRELSGAAARIRAEYGADARVVSVEEVRVGGLYGFFARRAYELVIEAADGGAAFSATLNSALREFASDAVPIAGAVQGVSRSSGIEGLLAEAERAEAALPTVVGGTAPAVSTQSDRFGDVLGSLANSIGATGRRAPDDPPLFRPTPGTLLAICGLRDDGLTVARSLALGLPNARVHVGGELSDGEFPRVDEHRAALAARARGVELGGVAIVAIGLGDGGPRAEANAVRLPSLGADLVWAAVDATRKPEDTSRWVAALRGAVSVREMAVLGSAHTESPESVHDLGLREAWSDSVR